MKLNLDQAVKDFEGKDIMQQVAPIDGVKQPDTVYTYKDVIRIAVNTIDEKNPMTAEKKVYAFQIGTKIFGKKLKEYDLTTEQVSFLKERIGVFFTPVVYGRFLELIGDLRSEE